MNYFQLMHMYRIVATIVLSICCIHAATERSEKAKFFLANIAQMIGHIGTIVETPRDHDVVESSVTNIVNNIVKITLHAVQKRYITISDAHDILRQLENVSGQCASSQEMICALKKSLIIADL